MNNETIPNYSTNDIKITPKEIEAVVVDIKNDVAKNVYGEGCNKPDQEIYRLHCENAEFDVKTEQTIPRYEKGSVPDNSKLGKFISRYGCFKSDMKIQLQKNDKGFWEIRT